MSDMPSRQEQIEEELRAAKEQLEIILTNIADGIVVQDATGKIIYANHAAALMTGYDSVEAWLAAPPLAYMERFDIFDEQGNPFPLNNLPGRRAIKGEAHPQETVRYVDKQTGKVAWNILKSTAIFDHEHKPYLVITVMQDITQLKELEQRKDLFISMASHELKTPVTSIIGFTQVLQKRFQQRDDEQSLHFLSIMDGQLKKLTNLINDLLDISKMQTGQLTYEEERFDLDELVRETVRNLQAATQSHQLLIEGVGQAQVLGDRDRIAQVLINLVANAIKYSPQANKVIVSISKVAGQAVVRVQDLGIGMAEAQQMRIFERFYQVGDPMQRTFPGLGIGLYISSEIIRRHRGKIWVESKKGEGSTFSFTIPLHDLNG
jgi:two-component system phosphate regulon sensor histidine kinase PhoR